MADYRLSVSVHSRSKGHSATAAAAYRSATLIRDERTGEIHDYARKGGILHSQIVLPADAPSWARNREQLWNAAEQSETRKNSTVARDFVVSLPAELNAAQRKELTLTLAGEISLRHHCAVDVALHRPSRGGDSRNFHAHLLCSTRRLRAEGFVEKTRELDDRKSGEILYWRERWADLQNERLKQHGHTDRVDHRTLKAQGIEREATQHRGPAIDGILARGERSQVVERRQEEANERLRLAKEAGELERERQAIDKSVIDLSGDLAAAQRERGRGVAAKPTVEERRREDLEKWLDKRRGHSAEPDSPEDKNPDQEKSRDRGRGIDDD
jgi:hypothetical protein